MLLIWFSCLFRYLNRLFLSFDKATNFLIDFWSVIRYRGLLFEFEFFTSELIFFSFFNKPLLLGTISSYNSYSQLSFLNDALELNASLSPIVTHSIFLYRKNNLFNLICKAPDSDAKSFNRRLRICTFHLAILLVVVWYTSNTMGFVPWLRKNVLPSGEIC